jgi:hypothetical protein
LLDIFATTAPTDVPVAIGELGETARLAVADG